MTQRDQVEKTAVEVKELNLWFGKKQVLENINIQFKSSTITALIGPSGSGKTTLAHIIAKKTKSDFIQISAVISGMKDLRAVIRRAKENEIEDKKTILFIDPVGGISGDMFLGAFLDLGLPLTLLSEGLENVGLNRLFALKVRATARHHIAARKVDFSVLEEGMVSPAPGTLPAIEKFLTDSALSNQIIEFALNVFYLLAEAEARVHGRSVEKVHFHEVGNYDTIADVVGVAIAIDWLKPD